MAIKVQGTTVIDDSRNITANVICGNFCGGSINISISPRTCNVGFVSGTSQVVCADQFESARIRSPGDVTVCVCSMPKGKPIFFDIGSTNGGTYCFKDTANTSMAGLSVTVPSNGAALVGVLQTPSFCGICCYIQTYCCQYNTWGTPSTGTGCFVRSDLFGATAVGISDVDAVVCAFSRGCCCETTLCVARCCITQVFSRNYGNSGLVCFSNGVKIGLYPYYSLNTESANRNSMGSYAGGFRLICGSTSSPSLSIDAMCNCWTCCMCQCSSCGAVGVPIGADTGNQYIYAPINTSSGSICAIGVFNLCGAFGSCCPFNGGLVSSIPICSCCRGFWNFLHNSVGPYMTYIQPSTTVVNSLNVYRGCKTGNSVCPLCLVGCCGISASIGRYYAANSSCGHTICVMPYWANGNFALITAGGDCEMTGFALRDCCPCQLCAAWCLVQEWYCTGPCIGINTALGQVVSPCGRFHIHFIRGGGPSGQYAQLSWYDACRGTSTHCNYGYCQISEFGNGSWEFAQDNETCLLGMFACCFGNCGYYSFCYEPTVCSWCHTQASANCCAAFRFFNCFCGCIPGCAGTLCRFCGSNGCCCCLCNVFPYLPPLVDLGSSKTTLFGFSQTTNHCCTCQS